VCGLEECHCEADKCTIQPIHRVCVEHTVQMIRDKLKAVTANKMEIGGEVLLGNPAAEIVNYVSNNPFNLVAMSPHERSGFSRWAFSSVSEWVLHSVSSPLLLGRPH